MPHDSKNFDALARTSASDRLAIGFAVRVVRVRRVVIAGWVAAVALAALFLPGLSSSLSVPPLLAPGSDSERAAHILSRAFPELGTEQAVVVFHSRTVPVESPTYQRTVQRVVAALAATRGVKDITDLPAVSTDAASPRTTYRMVALSGTQGERQAHSAAQQQAASRAAEEASNGDVEANVLGLTAAVSQMQDAITPSLRLAEALALGAGLIALILVLRRPLQALLPLTVAGGAVAVTLAGLSLVPGGQSADLLTVAVTSAVGLGIGLDYALLLVMRTREAFAAGASGTEAVERAVATAGKTLAYSAVTVIAGAASLLVVGIPLVRNCALGVITVTAATLLAALTLVPALAAQWPERLIAGAGAGADATPGGEMWERWARHLMRHPWRYTLAAVCCLGLAAVPAAGLRTGFEFDRQALATTPAGVALDQLERTRQPGAAATLMVVLPHPGQSTLPGLGVLMGALADDPGVAASVPIGNGRDTTSILVLPRSTLDSPSTEALVDRLRTDILPTSLPPDQQAVVGGAPVVMLDQRAAVDGNIVPITVCLLGGALVFLLVAFRSLILPVKAVLANIVVAAASFGLLHLATPWLSDGPPVVNHYVPLLTFVLLFALSLDYELFLVRRMREHYLQCGDNTAAVARGLARTATPISLAAVIMVLTFLSFLVIDSAQMRQFCLALAIAITLDATVVRLLLMPALMQLLGRYNWWLPSPRRRSHPQLPAQSSSPHQHGDLSESQDVRQKT
ncbi:MMPL family transporter [Streptomyces sp. NPDC096205]|uniref:MMPL family transporter n=1 Tax=Streptomyces sp. NPDC096205 TaxID=3366081 RepID=UPI00382F5624